MRQTLKSNSRLLRVLSSAAALSFVVLSGCFYSDDPTLPPGEAPTLQDKQHSIQKISQTLNLTVDETFASVLEVLRLKNVVVIETDKAKGVIKSDWVPMSDSLCGVYPNSKAPLPCDTQYSIEISSITPVASSFTISYVERCTSNSQLFVDCPKSNAEKLLLDIVDTLKLHNGIVDPDDY